MQILWYHYIVKFWFTIKNILIFRNSNTYHLFIKTIFTLFIVTTRYVDTNFFLRFWVEYLTICFFYEIVHDKLFASIFTFKGDVLYQIEFSLYFEDINIKNFLYYTKWLEIKKLKKNGNLCKSYSQLNRICCLGITSKQLTEDTWNFQIMLTLAYLEAWQFFFFFW